MSTLQDFTVKTLEGDELPLARYAGKVVLLVNVASRCGFTPQYKGLEALHRELGPKGLVVLGVPSNDFGAQEPGSAEEIRTFCSTNYDVSFPITAKTVVKGESKAPLYAWLTGEGKPAGEVKWNFEKFLVGKDGRVAGRFGSNVAPDAKELHAAIASALGA